MDHNADPETVVWENTFDHDFFRPDSFHGLLGEEDVWSIEEYWILEKALYGLSARPRDTSLPLPVQIALFDIYTRTLVRLFHFETQSIDGLSLEDCREWRNERLEVVFRGVFAGYTLDPKIMQPRNPLLV